MGRRALRRFLRRSPAGAERHKGLIVWGVGLLVLALVIGVSMTRPPALAHLSNLVFDSYQRLEPREEAGAPVVVVDIDERSIAKIGQWPWPRTTVAALVDRLGQLGAASIAFDMVFPEPDSPTMASASP